MSIQAIEGYPLSNQQGRVWELQQQSTTPWVTEASILIHGDLDPALLELAFTILVERHEILRTTYHPLPGVSGPVQVIGDVPKVESSEPSTDTIDLTAGPILQWNLERNAGKAVLRIKAAAIAADARSMGKMFEQLTAIYFALEADKQTELELIQYADYSQWQTDLYESSLGSEGKAFWKAKMDSLGSRVSDRNSAPGKTFQASVRAEIPAAVSDRLKRVAMDHGIKLETLLLCAWGQLLAVLDRKPEVPLGFVVDGRSSEELTHGIGLYDRFLPVKIAACEPADFFKLAHEVERNNSAMLPYAEFFQSQKANEPLLPQRLFSCIDAPKEASFGNTTFVLDDISSQVEYSTMGLHCYAGKSIRVELVHDSGAFTHAEAEILMDRFTSILSRLGENPASLPANWVIVEAKESALLDRFASSGETPCPPLILELFEKAVSTTPGSPAVHCQGKTISFGELDQRSNQLAHHLRKIGVQSGTPVALSSERSIEMIIGIIGILKSGGAYVPVDPGYPAERLAFILEDCNAPVLLTQPHLATRFPRNQAQVVPLSLDSLNSSREGIAPLAIRPKEEDLAYIIYTSGSTGRPKGVMITHSNLAYSTAARLQYYKEPVGNYLLLSSFAFDSSIAGIFWTLVQGGQLTLPQEGFHQDPAEIVKLVANTKVTHLLALPSFYRAILQRSDAASSLQSLRTVLVAGEACHRELVLEHFRKLPGTQLFNEYGPTEGTVWSTVHQCLPDSVGDQVPIGRPVPNLRVEILKEDLQPAGLGVVGEIHISGPTLTRGYLNRSRLNEFRFVSAPGKPGSRLYKTGDLGRFLPDGSIEFHGRIDDQVKIRGYRIELGEIESALQQFPTIAEAAVLAREDSSGDKRLVAYVTARSGATISTAELRQFLQSKLPSYMVPQVIVPIPKMPLNGNGKINRQALPKTEHVKTEASHYAPPSTPNEKKLATLWENLLKVEKVGVQQNFFELGGHSLLALQLLARVRDSFRIDLPLRSFFDRPTISGMAEALDQHRGTSPAADLQIKRIPRNLISAELLNQLDQMPNDTVSNLLIDSVRDKQPGNK